MSSGRAIKLFLLVSLAFWETWEAARQFGHPWGDLQNGVYSDHFSHMNVARLFPRVGIDIWRKPVDQMFRPLTSAEEVAVPADVRSGGSWSGGSYQVPGWSSSKPLVLGWSHDPRLYPPGHLLVMAPVAVLYHLTPITFTTANRLLLLLFILGAHVSLWVLARDDDATRSPRLFWLGFGASYALAMIWTLNGFFDAIVLWPIALSARALGRRRPAATLFWYCLAAFLHFRAYFFAPIAIAAAVEMVRQRRLHIAALAAAVLGLASLASFALVWSALKARPPENFVNLQTPNPIIFPAYLVAVIVTTVVLWRERARCDAGLCLWLAFMTVFYRYFCPWHAILAFLPWLFVPLPSVGNPSRIRAARLGFVVVSYLLTLV